MTEDNLSSKMSEFMTSLDQLKEYREILMSMTDFTIIILGTIITALSFNIVMRLSNLFIVADHGQNIVAYFLFFAIFPAGIAVAVFRVRQRVNSVKTREWVTTLNEGASGALKLIQELEWDSIFGSIRYAKLGFFIYGITKVIVYWGVAIAALYVLNWGLIWIVHFNIEFVILVVLALVVVVVLNRNDLRRRYEQIGRLDWLMWELRWFESEFRGADFEA
jgi:hypothetical protein